MRLSASLLRHAPWVVAGLLASTSLAACSHPRNVYDDSYHQQHRWDRREDAAYRRWETERGMQHIDYDRRSADEQRAYWNWRHEHPG